MLPAVAFRVLSTHVSAELPSTGCKVSSVAYSDVSLQTADSRITHAITQSGELYIAIISQADSLKP